MSQHCLGVCLLAAVFATNSSLGGEFELDGNIKLESRYFLHDAVLAEQDPSQLQASVHGTAEVRWYNEGGDQRVSFIQYGRWDETDSERTLYDIQEAYWALNFSDYELLVGVNTVFWGVTESVHLVDVINQTDAVADLDGEEKLGQAMVKFDAQKDWGLVSVYLLPYFRERSFAGSAGRLRTPLVVNSDDAQYESGEEQQHIDVALRYSHYFGDFDVGVSAFSGTSREPRLQLSSDARYLQPVYDQIHQLGLDVQYTAGAWLWKLESYVRDGVDDRFTAAVAGFEYTQYQLFETNMDLGYLLEYQYDGRESSEPATVADNDIFAGARLTFNDTQDTAILAGVVYDHESQAQFFNMEAERRLGQSYSLEARLRLINNAEQGDVLNALKHDDYFQLSIEKFF